MSDETAPEPGGRTCSDPTAELKVRARRRLIGSAALLLAAIVIVPAVLDSTPKPLPDAIPIEIPSEKTPFAPRLSLPPLPEPSTGSALPPDASPAPESSPPNDAKPEKAAATNRRPPPTAGETQRPAKTPEAKSQEKRAAEPKAVAPKPTDSKGADPKATDAKRASDLLEGRSTTPSDESVVDAKGRFVLQAAAPSSETTARELADRIAASGLKSYVERFDAKDGVRYRVRVGPYASRDDAERARARLRAIAVNSNLVAL